MSSTKTGGEAPRDGEAEKKNVKPMNRKTMQKNKIVCLPTKGRIYESAVEDTAVDMLDDYEEEIAAILSTPLDPEWYPDEESHLDIQIRDGLAEAGRAIPGGGGSHFRRKVCPTRRRNAPEGVYLRCSRGRAGIPGVAISGGPGIRRGPEGRSPMKAFTSPLQADCSWFPARPGIKKAGPLK